MSVVHFTAGKAGIHLCYTIKMLLLHETWLYLLLIYILVSLSIVLWPYIVQEMRFLPLI